MPTLLSIASAFLIFMKSKARKDDGLEFVTICKHMFCYWKGNNGIIIVQLNLGWVWFPFENMLSKKVSFGNFVGGETMELKDAITIMILFASFIIALLTYIGNNYKKK